MGQVTDPFMLRATVLRPNVSPALEMVCHVDRSVRAQLVQDDENGALATALRELAARGLDPVVINTSLNRNGEPLVETAEEACDLFEDSAAINALLLVDEQLAFIRDHEQKTAVISSWATIADRHATIGDRLSVKVVADALQQAGVPVERAEEGCLSTPEVTGPSNQVLSVWVCGPVDFSYKKQQAILGADGDGWIVSGGTLIGPAENMPVRADLSTMRDGEGIPTRADFAMLAPPGHRVRTAAVMLRGHQPEYRQDRSTHEEIAAAVAEALATTRHFPIALTTISPPGLEASEASATLESMLAQAAVVVTSRLHGIIHSVRAGVLPIVIDEVVGGGKVSACASAFGIPVLGPSPDLTNRLTDVISARRAESPPDVSDLSRRMQLSAQENLVNLVSLILDRSKGTRGDM